MDNLSAKSVHTMSEIDEQEELDQLLNPQSGFIEMDQVEHAANNYLDQREKRLIMQTSRKTNRIIKENKSGVIDEMDDFLEEIEGRRVGVLYLHITQTIIKRLHRYIFE